MQKKSKKRVKRRGGGNQKEAGGYGNPNPNQRLGLSNSAAMTKCLAGHEIEEIFDDDLEQCCESPLLTS
jgi:hypothetical protein